jgi:hypothetical protein
MRRLLLAAGAVAILVAISGCDPAEPRVTPAPTPSVTPVFASDEEALAAAEAAYAAYLAVSDAILADGGKDPERIYSVATESVGDQEQEGFEIFASKGYRSVGATTFDSGQIESVDAFASVDVVRIYICADSSSVDVVDSNGASVISPGRQARVPFSLGFDRSESTASGLILSSKELWQGGGVCD